MAFRSAMKCSPATPTTQRPCRASWPPWRTGMASEKNLAWLCSTGRRYIVGAPKSELKNFAAALNAKEGWRQIREDIEVKLTRHPETEETIILCRSADRRAKERAMHDKFSSRIQTALQRLAGRIAKAKKQIDLNQV